MTLTHNYSGGNLVLGFTHNGAHQIAGMTISDPAYLMKQVGTTTAYTPNALNQYTAVGSSSVSYDTNGNLTGDGSATFSYDEENRLRQVIAAGVTSVYAYDPLGRRRSKTVGATTTYFINDGPNELAELSSAGTRLRFYLNANAIDSHIAMFDDAGGAGWKFYHANHQGSVLFTSLYSSSGTIADQYQYGPFGEPLPTGALTGNPFRYTGRYLDAESGLYFYRARYYSQKLGRFLQTDPIGVRNDLDLYAYAHDDPLNSTDPTGTADCNNSSGGPCGGTGDAKWDMAKMQGKYSSATVAAASSSVAATAITAKEKMAQVRTAGKQGEQAAGIDPDKPKEQVKSRSGTAKYRILDDADDRTMTEVKNTKEFRVTNQIKDFVSEMYASGRDFIVKLREGATIGPKAQEYIRANGIQVRPIVEVAPEPVVMPQIEVQLELFP